MKWLLLGAAGVLLAAPSVNAAVIIDEDFEGLAGLPAGWFVVDNNAGANDPVFTIVAGHDGAGDDSGQAGHLGDMIDGGGTGNPNGGWFQAPQETAAASSWRLSFDVKFGSPPEGTADDATVVFGDLDNRNYYSLFVTEAPANNDLFYLLNDSRQGVGDNGTAVIGTDGYASGLVEESWYSGTLLWNATTKNLSFAIADPSDGSLLGSFATTLNGLQMVVDAGEFEVANPGLSGNVQFGFGSFNDNGTFDNILLETVNIGAGDVDGDGDADLADFEIIRTNFRQFAASRMDGDLSGDGFVDLQDFREWKDTQPAGITAASLGLVPEPGALLLALAIASLLGPNARHSRHRFGS